MALKSKNQMENLSVPQSHWPGTISIPNFLEEKLRQQERSSDSSKCQNPSLNEVYLILEHKQLSDVSFRAWVGHWLLRAESPDPKPRKNILL